MKPIDIASYKDSFLKSAKKHLRDIEFQLENLKSTIETEEIVNDLYLHLHSLKGECGVMSYNKIANLCDEALVILKSEQIKMTSSQNIASPLNLVVAKIRKELEIVENEEDVIRKT